MASHSSVVALGLSSQPSCSTPLSAQRNSFPGLHLPSQSCLLSQDSFFRSSNGSFCDSSDAVASELFDCSYSIPDPQLIRRIVSQVEFYLSDENLAKDAFLLKHVQKNKLGFVSIKLLTSFKKVKYLTRDWRLTLYALRFSKLLEVNQEGTKVRRRVPIPDSILNVPPTKLLLAWDPLPQAPGTPLPLQKNFIETITQMFSPFGAIASIRILRPGRKLPSDNISLWPIEALPLRVVLFWSEAAQGRAALKAFQRLSRPHCPCWGLCSGDGHWFCPITLPHPGAADGGIKSLSVAEWWHHGLKVLCRLHWYEVEELRCGMLNKERWRPSICSPFSARSCSVASSPSFPAWLWAATHRPAVVTAAALAVSDPGASPGGSSGRCRAAPRSASCWRLRGCCSQRRASLRAARASSCRDRR
uniref:HTH La-type RNA-binding domain-containing protein n=1 Tax=Pavo cristatus TaxID=9049 RepID=A0A8C9FMB9_PAVCR